jgi:hypothetical protein
MALDYGESDPFARFPIESVRHLIRPFEPAGSSIKERTLGAPILCVTAQS